MDAEAARCGAHGREPVARMPPEIETVDLHVNEAAVLIPNMDWRMDEKDLVVLLLETALLIAVVRVVGGPGAIHVVGCIIDACL